MPTQWKPIYGPIATADAAAHDIYTVPAGVSLLITKFSVSNKTGVAATATVKITPAGGTAVQVYQRSIPGYPVQGGIMELAELEGQMIDAGGVINFQDGTGAALVPFISGVLYTA